MIRLDRRKSTGGDEQEASRRGVDDSAPGLDLREKWLPWSWFSMMVIVRDGKPRCGAERGCAR